MIQVLKNSIRESVLCAATEIFYERGYENSSIREIASTAGVSTSNLYNYFSGKSDLFDAIISPVVTQLDELMATTLSKSASDKFGEDNIREVANAFALLIKANRYEFLIIMERSEGTKYAAMREGIISMLAANANEIFPDVPDEDKVIFSIIFSSLISGIIELLKLGRDDDWTERNIREFIKFHKRNLAEFVGVYVGD